MIKESKNLIDEEIKERKKLKNTLEARVLENNLKIKELEEKNV